MTKTTGRVTTYGEGAIAAALIHGGPGAAGEMAAVGNALRDCFAVIEPHQTANTIAGLIQELATQIRENSRPPITLVGFSWGALLAVLTCHDYPSLVNRMVLIGCPPLDDHRADEIEPKRLERLTAGEQLEYRNVITDLAGAETKPARAALARLAALALKTDQVDPVVEADRPGISVAQMEAFRAIWPQAAKMRSEGVFKKIIRRIHCPVTAIHGREDPHPLASVSEVFSANVKDFRLVVLENCGHKPWIERNARRDFYRVLVAELSA